jgi:hypothetical protein
LQGGEAASQAGEASNHLRFVATWSTAADFTEAAALIAHLDLVITVDTAVAHLAGSMGKPVWILLSTFADWGWGIQGTQTEWYPTECFATGVDERLEFLIHVRVDVGGDCLIQNKVDAPAAQLEPEQENGDLIACDIFKFTPFIPGRECRRCLAWIPCPSPIVRGI